jgi:hypothetical protein
MNDRVDLSPVQHPVEQGLIADVSFHHVRFWRQHPPCARRQIVDHHDLFAAFEQIEHHVAADVASAACNQD